MGYFVRKLEELPVSKVEGAHGGTGVLEVVQLLGNQEGVGFPGNPDDFEFGCQLFTSVGFAPRNMYRNAQTC